MGPVHSHPLPGFLRDLVTDALQTLWRFSDSYGAIVPRLSKNLAVDGCSQVLDLCSGGGGPWLNLMQPLEEKLGHPLRMCLSDKYPNLLAFATMRSQSRAAITFIEQAIDATQVPTGISGFRTLFSSFHHFEPKDAQEVLRSSVAAGQGIGIFEVPQRNFKTMLLLCFTPLLVLWLTIWLRPFRWTRLIWTYLVPIVPFVIGFDGLVSCLKAYSVAELTVMVREVQQEFHTSNFEWEVGVENRGLLPVTYLIGCPV